MPGAFSWSIQLINMTVSRPETTGLCLRCYPRPWMAVLTLDYSNEVIVWQ